MFREAFRNFGCDVHGYFTFILSLTYLDILMFTAISSDPIRTNDGSYESRTVDLQVEKIPSRFYKRNSILQRSAQNSDLENPSIYNVNLAFNM